MPDALVSPAVAATTGAVGLLGLGYGLRRVERGPLQDRTPAAMGMLAAFIFAAQMVKFPVGPGVAGHLLGGVLAAVVLGPWAGAAVIGAVLIVQCFVFGDGGVTALGANFLNMGLVGAVGGYAVYAPIRRLVGGRPGVLIGAMVAAWASVILAAGAFSLELAASGRWSDFPRVLGWMALVHAGIGVGEALITGAVLRSVLLARPELIHDLKEPGEPGAALRWGQTLAAGLAAALVVGVFLAPFGSSQPDGLEFVGARLGFLAEDTPSVIPAPIPDYVMPLPGISSLALATALSGLVGTLVVFGVALALARGFARKAPGGIGADAA